MLQGRYANQALGLLRIVAGLLFLLHGASKLFGIPPFAGGELPAVGTLLWIGAVIELVGGALIMIGLFTRPAAFVASGQMAVAYWMFHAPRDLYPSNNGGDAAILYCFIFLLFAAAGPGAFSIDRKRNRKVVLVDDELE